MLFIAGKIPYIDKGMIQKPIHNLEFDFNSYGKCVDSLAG
jgi:hypothetical protein